jgi:hypothetical protein
MAEIRGREAIVAAYQAARGASDAEAMRRFQNEEACLVPLAIRERLASEPESFDPEREHACGVHKTQAARAGRALIRPARGVDAPRGCDR